jgi:hypothetical protein
LQLPLPWPPGSSEVQLIGVVAQRRRWGHCAGCDTCWTMPATVCMLAERVHIVQVARKPGEDSFADVLPYVLLYRQLSVLQLILFQAGCTASCGMTRRIAKLLLFCSLVPESVPPLPADGTAAYVRRLWQHPHHPEVPCEVSDGSCSRL